ncbi:MAG: efflux RND transporter periplasmic adaptor subunit [Halarcobacter sp.]
MKKNIITLFFVILFSNSLNALEISGTIISDNEKIITSRYMGFIKNVYVNEGDFVNKGELLYEIDSSNIDSNKKEAQLNIQILENNLNNLQINYDRYKRLYKKDLVPKYDVEQLKLKLENVKNMLKIAKAKLKEVKQQYQYLKIKAPNNGLILKKSIKSGEMAMPSSPAMILSDLSSLKVKAEIAESFLNSIKIGQSVDLYIESIDFKTKGEILAIFPNTQNMTHTFILKIGFDTKNRRIYPGMYSKIFMKVDQDNVQQ